MKMLYIAENLKALRKKKEWTQEEIAEIIGVSPQSVSKWERGDTFPDITLLPALANLYNVTIDFIVGMEKINETNAKDAIFKSGHEHLRNGDRISAEKVFADALKIYPADESFMSELALVLALESDSSKLAQAANLCERVLAGSPTEKVRSTTRCAICFIYFKMGEKDKAVTAAKHLPHIRESRENVLAEFNNASAEDIDAYIRFIALGECDADSKIIIDFGINIIPICHSIPGKIKALRQELGLNENATDLQKLPHIRIRDNINLPPNRVRIRHYADLILDKDFYDPLDVSDEIIKILKAIASK